MVMAVILSVFGLTKMQMTFLAAASGIALLLIAMNRYHVHRQRVGKAEVIDLLQRRLDGAVGQSQEWTRFTDAPFKDPWLESVRRRCLDFDLLVTEGKRAELKKLISELREQK
jgi:hypothetical protein